MTAPFAHPYESLLGRLLPSLLSLIRCLHGLWDAFPLDRDALAVLQISALERHQILTNHDAPASESLHSGHGSATVALADRLEDVRSFLVNGRQMAYQCLGQLTPIAGFYALDGLSAHLLAPTVFSHVVSIEVRHWRALWASFVRPFVAHCPPERFDHVLRPIMPALLTFIAERLEAEWTAVAALNLPDEHQQQYC